MLTVLQNKGQDNEQIKLKLPASEILNEDRRTTKLEIRFLNTNEMNNSVELAATHFEQNNFFTG